jgi:hypothetical protein
VQSSGRPRRRIGCSGLSGFSFWKASRSTSKVPGPMQFAVML